VISLDGRNSRGTDREGSGGTNMGESLLHIAYRYGFRTVPINQAMPDRQSKKDISHPALFTGPIAFLLILWLVKVILV